MSKTGNSVLVAALSALAFVGLTANAEAHYRYGGCCGPVPPTVYYHPHSAIIHKTYFSDVYKYQNKYIPHIIKNVTVIHPEEYITHVVRVHHREVPVIVPHYEAYTTTLPTTVHMSTQVVNLLEGCYCCKK